MLKLKLQYFGHLMGRADSLEKTLILGKIEGRRRRGQQRMRWLDGVTDSVDKNLSKRGEIVEDREAWWTIAHRVTKSQTRVKKWNTHSRTHTRQGYILPFCLFNLHAEFSTVQSLSHVQLFVTSWTAAHQASLSINNTRSLLKFMSIESVMSSNHLILCHPLLLLPSIFPSIRVFSNESVLPIRWPKYWSFSFNISPFNEFSGLISFSMDWFDLLAVQGTLKSLLQHHGSKASILRRSAFLFVQLSHPYMTAGKTIAVTRWTLSAKKCLCSLIYCLGLS